MVMGDNARRVLRATLKVEIPVGDDTLGQATIRHARLIGFLQEAENHIGAVIDDDYDAETEVVIAHGSHIIFA